MLKYTTKIIKHIMISHMNGALSLNFRYSTMLISNIQHFINNKNMH